MSLPPALARRSLKHLRQADPVLAAVIKQVGPLQLKLQARRFESLARAIIAQQISSAAARSIWNRLHGALRPKRITAASLAGLTDIELRQLGISPQKVAYLRDLQLRVERREVRLDRLRYLTDEDVIAELTQVKGIGVWTAQMFLMFSLGRPDVLPHQDLGIRSALARLYQLGDLPDRETCEEIARPWRPYATVACWYLWRSSEL